EVGQIFLQALFLCPRSRRRWKRLLHSANEGERFLGRDVQRGVLAFLCHIPSFQGKGIPRMPAIAATVGGRSMSVACAASGLLMVMTCPARPSRSTWRAVHAG